MVVLPLGRAFYSLRLIHYLLESYKGNLRAHDLEEYLCYQLLPSTLPVGPIHRFDEFLREKVLSLGLVSNIESRIVIRPVKTSTAVPLNLVTNHLEPA